MNGTLHSTFSVFIALAFVVAPLSGCKKDSNEAEVETSSGAEAPPAPEPVVQVEGDGGLEECALSTVYFAFDSAELDSKSRSEIQRAVECYRSKGATVRLRLVGATDPRGTEEYNIALGERRAQSVRGYLVSLGVDAGRLSVTSVGEEMASGTTESSWAQDRNVSAAEK